MIKPFTIDFINALAEARGYKTEIEEDPSRPGVLIPNPQSKSDFVDSEAADILLQVANPFLKQKVADEAVKTAPQIPKEDLTDVKGAGDVKPIEVTPIK